MERLVLKTEIIDTIKKEPVLFGAIAEVLGKSVFTLITLLRSNDPSLTQASVLKIICSHLKVKDNKSLMCQEREITGV